MVRAEPLIFTHTHTHTRARTHTRTHTELIIRNNDKVSSHLFQIGQGNYYALYMYYIFFPKQVMSILICTFKLVWRILNVIIP